MAEERKPKVNQGPGGPRGPRGPRPKLENPMGLLKRMLGYTFKDYVKSGLPLILVSFALCMILLPILFPFYH